MLLYEDYNSPMEKEMFNIIEDFFFEDKVEKQGLT